MIETTCCVCDVKFSMPDALYNSYRQTGKCFACPNGHQQMITKNWKTEYERLLKAKQESEQYWQRTLDRRDAQITMWRHRANTYKGLYSKLKARAK